MKIVIHFLLDPRVFNYVILVLYIFNTIRWAFHRSLGDVLYWGGATCIILGVTFGNFRR